MEVDKSNCPHTETIIVVQDAWDIHEQIAYQCTACKKIVKTQNN